MSRDTFSDIATLVYPDPIEDNYAESEAYEAAQQATVEARSDLIEGLRLGWEETDSDPLLSQIAVERARWEEAENNVRNLIAYAREFVKPHPYQLAELAQAANMSVAGVRIAYNRNHTSDVAQALRTQSPHPRS